MFAVLSPILTYRNKPTACVYEVLTWKIVTFTKPILSPRSHPSKTLNTFSQLVKSNLVGFQTCRNCARMSVGV